MNFSTELLNKVANESLPVYILNNFVPVLKTQKGGYSNKVVVLSIPKAGTYLLARLLQMVGYEDTEVHLSSKFFADYRWKTLEQKREYSLRVFVNMEASDVTKMIRTGQFVVGHLPCNAEMKETFSRLKKIFAYRDLRDAIVSHMRFCARKNIPGLESWSALPDGPEKLLKFINTTHGREFFDMVGPMVGWLSESNVLPVSFEKLYDDGSIETTYGEIGKILEYLEIPDHIIPKKELIQKVFGTETVTFSGKRTNREVFWSDKVEQLFQEVGGDKLNILLGY